MGETKKKQKGREGVRQRQTDRRGKGMRWREEEQGEVEREKGRETERTLHFVGLLYALVIVRYNLSSRIMKADVFYQASFADR